MLNLAEAKVRSTIAVDAGAIALLNALRGRSNASAVYKAADFTTSAALIDAILLERSIEFLGEGLLNNDVRRLLQTIPAKGSVVSVAPTKIKYIWPIPANELDSNERSSEFYNHRGVGLLITSGTLLLCILPNQFQHIHMHAVSKQKSAISNIEVLAKLMDSQFTIPGTSIKFGLDALVGLIPGVGDFATLFVSGYMVAILAKNGASKFVVARMTLNILIDALLGTIPIIGDIFDVAFRANDRNVQLMREHYVEGRHKGGAWKVVVPIMLLLVLLVGALAWVSYKLFVWLFY